MSKNKAEKLKTRVSIGGQAVLEGVYMRGAKAEATAVRDADGVIRLETKRKNAARKNFFLAFAFNPRGSGVYRRAVRRH